MQITVGTDNSGPLPEWIIIELQGLLECKNDTEEMGGKFVGDLHYTKEGIPLLIIGHHCLYGKIAKLDKPLVMLIKSESETDPNLIVTAVIRRKLIFKTRPKPIVPQNNKPPLIDLS